MGASATLPTTVTGVVPGDQATCPVVVSNTGSVVDQFQVEVVGEAAEWTTVEPPSVGLLPGESATVVLRFAPPRSPDIAARQVHFAVHVSSQEDPEGSVVEEGTVEVGAFTEVTVELSPITAEGSRQARFEVVVDNAGNHPVEVELRAVDREDALEFRLERTRFTLDAGTVAFVPLRARPRDRFLRGPSVRHPFQVQGSLGYGDPLVADGTMVQRQLLPKWLLPALIALLLFAVALFVLWLTVLRPAVRTAARAVAQQQVVQVQLEAQQAKQEAAAAQQQADAAEQDVKGLANAIGVDPENIPPPDAPPTVRPSTPPAEPARELTDFRIAANAAPANDLRAFTRFPVTPADDKVFLLTDLVLQNPRGHRGTLQILRQRGDTNTVLWEVGLDNYRDHDQHWVSPWRFLPGDRVVVAVNCQNIDRAAACTPAVSFSGHLEDPPT